MGWLWSTWTLAAALLSAPDAVHLRAHALHIDGDAVIGRDVTAAWDPWRLHTPALEVRGATAWFLGPTTLSGPWGMVRARNGRIRLRPPQVMAYGVLWILHTPLGAARATADALWCDGAACTATGVRIAPQRAPRCTTAWVRALRVDARGRMVLRGVSPWGARPPRFAPLSASLRPPGMVAALWPRFWANKELGAGMGSGIHLPGGSYGVDVGAVLTHKGALVPTVSTHTPRTIVRATGVLLHRRFGARVDTAGTSATRTPRGPRLSWDADVVLGKRYAALRADSLHLSDDRHTGIWRLRAGSDTAFATLGMRTYQPDAVRGADTAIVDTGVHWHRFGTLGAATATAGLVFATEPGRGPLEFGDRRGHGSGYAFARMWRSWYTGVLVWRTAVGYAGSAAVAGGGAHTSSAAAAVDVSLPLAKYRGTGVRRLVPRLSWRGAVPIGGGPVTGDPPPFVPWGGIRPRGTGLQAQLAADGSGALSGAVGAWLWHLPDQRGWFASGTWRPAVGGAWTATAAGEVDNVERLSVTWHSAPWRAVRLGLSSWWQRAGVGHSPVADGPLPFSQRLPAGVSATWSLAPEIAIRWRRVDLGGRVLWNLGTTGSAVSHTALWASWRAPCGGWAVRLWAGGGIRAPWAGGIAVLPAPL